MSSEGDDRRIPFWYGIFDSGIFFCEGRGGGGGGGVPPPPKSIKQNKNISFCSFIDGEFLNSIQARSCSKGIELFVLEIQSSMHEVKGS